MPRNRTEWMIAHSVVVQGHARPQSYTAEDDTQNVVACLMIQRTSGVGTLIIEGRPDDLIELARKLLAEAEEISRTTLDSPELRSLYGRV